MANKLTEAQKCGDQVKTSAWLCTKLPLRLALIDPQSAQHINLRDCKVINKVRRQKQVFLLCKFHIYCHLLPMLD